MLTQYETDMSVQTIPPPAKTPNTFLLCLFLLLFPVFPAVPYHCDHWSDIRGHYSLPGSPQGCPSAAVEVSIWVLHPRHSRAGRPHCFHQQRHGGGHMEFNAVHSYVTNRIRILHQVAVSQQSRRESLGCFSAAKELVLYLIFCFFKDNNKILTWRKKNTKVVKGCQHLFIHIFIFFNICSHKHVLVYVSMFQWCCCAAGTWFILRIF